MLSDIGNTQINRLSIPGKDKTFQQLDSTTVTPYNDTITQVPFTTTYSETSNQSVMCQKSVYSTLESKVDIFHAQMQTNTGALQDHIHHRSPISNEWQPSLERTDDTGYVMINLEPVTLTFDKNAYVPVQTEVVNRGDKPVTFNTELINQVTPTASLGHPVSTVEKSQIQSLGGIPPLAVSGQKGANYLSGSLVTNGTLAEETYSLQKEIPLTISSPSDNAVVMKALSLVKSSSYPSTDDKMKQSQELFMQTQNLFSICSEEIVEPSQVVVSPSASTTLEKKYSLNCIPSKINTSDDSFELRKNDKSGVNNENMHFDSFNSIFATKQTSLSPNRDEVILELSEEDSDIDLTLTISPPTSPRKETPSDEIEQLEDVPLSNVELQDVVEEIAEPEEVTLMENRPVNSVCPAMSEKLLENKEKKSDNLQPVTLILSKENCTLEIAEEVVTSDFRFDSLIEEVSPASSPDPPVSIEETRPTQSVSPCSLTLYGTQCEKSNKFSQIGSGDLALTEKENSLIGPDYTERQGNFTQVQQIQLSADTPQVLTNHPGRKDRLALPGKVTEEIVPTKKDEGLSFSEKVQCYDTKLNQPVSTGQNEGNKPSLEKLVKLGNSLQPVSIENRHLDLKHLVLESSEPPFSPRKINENKSLADTLVSTATLSDIMNMPIKQQSSPKSIKKNFFHSDLKTDYGSSSKADLLNSDSIDGTDAVHLNISKFGPPSDGTTLTHYASPVSVEPGFRTQEISVVRMASLLNSETETELHEENIDLHVANPQSDSTSTTSEQKICILQNTSWETKELLNGELFPKYAGPYQKPADTSKNINKEPSAFSIPKSFDSLVCEISKEHVESNRTTEGCSAEADSETLGRDRQNSVNSDIYYEALSEDHDQLDMEDSYTLSGSHTRKKDATKGGFDTFMRVNNDNEGWSYFNKVPELETNIPPRSWAIGLNKDKCVPCYIQIRDLHGIPRTYPNFTITKELKDTTGTLHSPRRQPGLTAHSGLLSIWTRRWHVPDDLTQNTLDLEYLRFAHKLKQIVKNGDSQCSTPTSIFPKESPTQIVNGALSLTNMSEVPILRTTSKNRSPLLVTIVHSDARQQSQPLRGHSPRNLDSSSPWKERSSYSRNLTNSQRNKTVSFHLNKLKYNSASKESRNDISLILNEYAEFNKVVMNDNSIVFQDKDLIADSGETTSQEMYTSSPRRSASFEDMITDLCTSLHVKLKSVMKEACKSTFLFYLVETEDKSFSLRTKNILRKGGHTEIEPHHFCQAFQREDDKLIVIIRNEDISSHLHQIPSLLQLKHLPSVIFAGVDSPEDVTDYTYQELFRTGGFVISDDKILETLTLVQLKEIVKTLEKLNGNGRWKWLLHYRENKKLKEIVRVDSVAHKKNLILKSYQGANIIELLHYHQCDSQSSTKTEILKCLISLQIQRIDARFAVFLTDRPTVSREVFENSGILVTDVNDFIENIQKVASPFRSSYW